MNEYFLSYFYLGREELGRGKEKEHQYSYLVVYFPKVLNS